jgi:hypothetical protein
VRTPTTAKKSFLNKIIAIVGVLTDDLLMSSMITLLSLLHIKLNQFKTSQKSDNQRFIYNLKDFINFIIAETYF